MCDGSLSGSRLERTAFAWLVVTGNVLKTHLFVPFLAAEAKGTHIRARERC
jgi:hypothetical protein